MAFTNRHLSLLTAVVALVANACSVAAVRPTETAGTPVPVRCEGGSVASAADAARYGACDSVTGDLRISAAELTDLSALARLRSVSGTLEISRNPQLDDLAGLEQLNQVGALVISNNADLDDLSGLQNLQHAGSVTIAGNMNLRELQGLDGLSRTDKLVIEHNGLYQTSGLSNLREVGALVIRDNAKLHSLTFRSLTHARSLEIRHNPWLCAKGMLPGLTSVDEQVTVVTNRGLSQSDVQQLLGRFELGSVRTGEHVAGL